MHPVPSSIDPSQPHTPLFARLGAEPFRQLASGLYTRIDGDPRIRAMFPEDLSAQSDAVNDMSEFLIQFFGGPQTYSERKGHPRLRARHMRFPITTDARDAWLSKALGALAEVVSTHQLDERAHDEIHRYLVATSQFMINTDA